MSAPKGDLLNQPGVGFIVAEQAQVSLRINRVAYNCHKDIDKF